ncbi:hypothetical protein A2U01_0109838, partial [Trifolium medium]|nr:hypothetical protein [Trifolium medium]
MDGLPKTGKEVVTANGNHKPVTLQKGVVECSKLEGTKAKSEAVSGAGPVKKGSGATDAVRVGDIVVSLGV